MDKPLPHSAQKCIFRPFNFPLPAAYFPSFWAALASPLFVRDLRWGQAVLGPHQSARPDHAGFDLV